MDALGELAHVVQQLAGLGLQLGQRRGGGGRVAGELVAGDPQLGDQGDDVLLSAVVKIALEAAALLVLGLQDARARGRQLAGLPLGLVHARLELGGETGAADAQRGLAGERGEQPEVAPRRARPRASDRTRSAPDADCRA